MSFSADFSLLFPQSYRSLIDLADDLQAETVLDRVVSSCPLFVREIPPLFALPGLGGKHCDELQNMVSKIMYPVYCVRYGTRAATIPDIATEAVKVSGTTLTSSSSNFFYSPSKYFKSNQKVPTTFWESPGEELLLWK